MKKIDFDTGIYRVIMIILGSVFSTCVLAFSVLTIISINKGNYEIAPSYLFWVFIFLSLVRLVTFIKDRTKLNLIRCLILLAVDIGIGIAVLFANNNPYIFCISGGLYCITIIVSRIFKLIQKHDLRNIIINSLIILLALLMAIGMFSADSQNSIQDVIVVECLFIAIVSFFEVAIAAFAQLKVKVLFKIVIKTYSLEVIFGLLTMMVGFSLVFMVYEPAIETFGDALWYSFAVVTTIGFGDYTAVTVIGRILTVILGIYGLIIVAILTSIIVNFYNETRGQHYEKHLKEIKKEEEKNAKE